MMAEDHANNALDGAAQSVVGAPQGNRVAFTLVLLGSEVQANPRGCLNFMERGGRQAEAAAAQVQPDVGEGEGGVVVGGTGVFTRTKKEEEREADHICVR